MISWMQRHKKWLVITIWISTIAFVGAGFVGWGSYSLSTSSNVAAKVGDIEVKFSDVNDEYVLLYNDLNNLFGGQFNKQLAKQFNLERVALEKAINNALLLNFAKENDIIVTDKEVVKELLKNKAFYKNNKFDKETYIKVLKQNRLKPVEYEAKIKKSLLISKVIAIFKQRALKNEIDNFNLLYGISDKLKVKVVSKNKKFDVKITDKEIKEYWKKNKDKYKTNKIFVVLEYKVKLLNKPWNEKELKEYYKENKLSFKKADGTIKTFEEAKDDIKKALDKEASKKEALRTYIKLKKDKLSWQQEIKTETMQGNKGDIFKPVFEKDVFVIRKIKDIILPKTKTFDEVRDIVRQELIFIKEQKAFDEYVNKLLNKFSGINLGFVSIKDVSKVSKKLSISNEEALLFLQNLFMAKNKKGKIDIGKVIVLFEILDSKLTSVNFNLIDDIIGYKNKELNNRLIKRLKEKYEIVRYVK